MIYISGALALLFIIVRTFKGGIVALLLKIVASISFIALGFYYLNDGYTFSKMLIVGGLIFGLIGDILLDLKIIYPEDNNTYLFSGVISFTLQHITIFIAIFLLTNFNNIIGNLYLILLIPLLITIIGYLSFKLFKMDLKNALIISLLYLFLLSYVTMYYLISTIKDINLIYLLIGMILFIFSDLILSFMYFKDNQKNKYMIVLNHVLYYSAQILIAIQIFYL